MIARYRMDCSPITPDLDEALRYAGVRADESGDMHRKMADIAAQCMRVVSPRYTYRVSEIAWESGMPSLFGGQLLLPGKTAALMLRTCSHAALLVCTLGATFDALERQAQIRDFSDALLLNGFGGAYVEAGCNAAEGEIAQRMPGKYLTDRFSPGYGDLPLNVQGALLALTDAQRRLGITLSDTNLMNPLKSVTAVIGLSDVPQQARIRGCDHCAMRTRCNLRKAGKTCGE